MDRKKLLSLLLALLLPICAAPALADGDVTNAPEALDIFAPAESQSYEFDFLPWFTSPEDAQSIFQLDDTVRLHSNDGSRTTLEFGYPSALTGSDARVQLIFDALTLESDPDAPPALSLTGVCVIETFADHDGQKAWIDSFDARFNGFNYIKVSHDDPQFNVLLDAMLDVSRHLDNPYIQQGHSECGATTAITRSGPDGIERNLTVESIIGTAKVRPEYFDRCDEFCAVWCYQLETAIP